MRERFLKEVKRVVVKVGTSVLAHQKNDLLDTAFIKGLVSQISKLLDKKIQVILVSSGAVGAGMGLLGIKRRPELLPELQAAAAIGQSHLMKLYDSSFKSKGHLTAQILLTAEDLNNRARYLNARNTISKLLEHRATPIINENDSVSVDEIKFGDNDTLAGLVANLVEADLLIILSDVDGLHRCYSKECGPETLIDTVDEVTTDILRLAKRDEGRISVGGMYTKIQAARMTTSSGIPVVIANGRTKEVLLKIIRGDKVGTLFISKKAALPARKRWIAYSAAPKGIITIDQGAKEALVKKGSSLLARGAVGISGRFKVGDVVAIVDEGGNEFARGLVNYSSDEAAKIRGLKTNEIESKLGHRGYDELVHRDNLVIL